MSKFSVAGKYYPSWRGQTNHSTNGATPTVQQKQALKRYETHNALRAATERYLDAVREAKNDPRLSKVGIAEAIAHHAKALAKQLDEVREFTRSQRDALQSLSADARQRQVNTNPRAIAVEQEIRAHLRNLSDGERAKVLMAAARDGNHTVLDAVRGVPEFLYGGMNADVAELIEASRIPPELREQADEVSVIEKALHASSALLMESLQSERVALNDPKAFNQLRRLLDDDSERSAMVEKYLNAADEKAKQEADKRNAALERAQEQRREAAEAALQQQELGQLNNQE